MNMKAVMIQQLMNALLMFLSPEVMKKGLDGLLDIIEDAVINSETEMDDVIVLNLCNQVRRAFDVADNDAL